MNNIINKIKKETNNNTDIIYRKKIINNQQIYIIYSESLTSSDTISDFIIRSLDIINNKYNKKIDLYKTIINEISNSKITLINSYKDIINYLNNGFTIIIIENNNKYLALETRRNLSHGIDKPLTETTLRSATDAFVEDIQTNTGLIKRRIKTNNLWKIDTTIGTETKTNISIFYMNNKTSKKLIKEIKQRINNINIDAVIDIGTIKNQIENETKSLFPTVLTSERPDRASNALLEGKIVIIIDTLSFCLILPTFFNDNFKSMDDNYGKSLNITFTRIIRYLSFFITILTPGLYIALTTFNQDILQTEALINIANQRNLVPIPTFFEALIMIIAFELLRESDLRIPSISNSALSIVGALIIGDAAVNAGIVSPIMIIVISITAITSLLFTEPEFIYAIRFYRLFLMITASLSGLIGLTFATLYLIINLTNLTSFGLPYLMPYVPTHINSLKNSIIKFPTKHLINLTNKNNRRLK